MFTAILEAKFDLHQFFMFRITYMLSEPVLFAQTIKQQALNFF